MPNASPALEAKPSPLAAAEGVAVGEPFVADAALGADETAFGVRMRFAVSPASGSFARGAVFVSWGVQSDVHAGSTVTVRSAATTRWSAFGIGVCAAGSPTKTVSTSGAATSMPRPDQTSAGGGAASSAKDERTFTHMPTPKCSWSDRARATAKLRRATLKIDTVKRTEFPHRDFHGEIVDDRA
jgi:hypothetical protein